MSMVIGRAVVFVVVGSLSSVAVADKVVGVEVTASSSAAGKADKFAAWRAVDNATGTAWCEGAADEGLDETLTLTLAEPMVVPRLDLYVGKNGSAKEFDDNNRISKLSAKTAPKTGDALTVLAKAAPITTKFDMLVKLDLKTPRTIQVLEVGFGGITRGKDLKQNATCISEISLVGDKGEVINFLGGISADAMASLPSAINVLTTAIAGCDEKVLSYAVQFPFEHRIAAEEDSRTVKHKNAKALAKACRAKGFPKIPADAGKADLSSTGNGRVSLEAGGDLLRMDMQWTAGQWKLASFDSY
jgi:hypothetical protein